MAWSNHFDLDLVLKQVLPEGWDSLSTYLLVLQ